MTEDLAATLGRQETATLEFKREATNRDAIREAICALANDLTGAGGGVLLIGVGKDGTPHPVDTGDEALLAITNLRDDGKILDRPSMVVTAGIYGGEPVIRVDVHASSSPPVRVNGIVWVRPGPSTRRATADDERVLSERRLSLAVPFDSRPVLGSSLRDLDAELLRSTYIPAAVDADVLADNHRPLVEQLASLRLCTSDGVPTTCGLLVGGFDPSAHLPGAYVQFVRYDGPEADAPVVDEEELRGNLVNATRALESLLTSHVHTRLRDAGGFQEESWPDYPLDALRELTVNALVHRNYESSNAPTRVSWFTDRIEIVNPGGPYGQVRPDNFGRVNDYRNPSLAGAMKTLGYANRFGRGITRVASALQRNGNPSAEYDITDAYWAVTVRRIE
ncbi:putative transcriptional regulator [Blastococcus saxobsidens DD2]|uniref:Putative transcriptional regulator n=2 Tax=Blastococcus saxobsidens TaxID=138336 RepID=H6RSX0_BLASD|nr:putative transcriptional regulator [Blastococcus saxobsidens DD2]